MKKRQNKFETHYVRNVRPQNEKQVEYMEALDTFPVIFGIGSAGTGKTYLAVCQAIKELDNQNIGKIILVRPAVASEDLGYLPGTLEEKIDPYMRPLFDALDERWGTKKVESLLASRTIECAPLAFMRGRTFSHAAVIFDEAQNATIEQMKLLLTRLGDNIKCMINGDIYQSDLGKIENGLQWAARKLQDCPSVGIVKFSNEEVVRSELTKQLLEYLE